MKTIGDFRDKHKGDDVFVFGASPELHHFDMSLIKGRATICVNSSILKIKTPTYYFTSDGHQIYKKHWEFVQAGDFPIVLNRQSMHGYRQVADSEKNKNRVVYYEKEHTDKLNKNADKIIFGISSIHCATHFASILGAKRIIVIGANCKFTGDKLHFYDYDGEIDDTIADKKIEAGIPTYPRTNDTNGMMEAMLCYWQTLRSENPNANIVVQGDRLEKIFPKYEND